MGKKNVKNAMRYTKTDRGFVRYEFTDRYDQECSLQESSLASENAIWLGINAVSIEPSNLVEVDGVKRAMARMHLTQDGADELIPLLQYFVKHGELPPPPKKD